MFALVDLGRGFLVAGGEWSSLVRAKEPAATTGCDDRRTVQIVSEAPCH
jgi:hypothetical protein